MRTDKDGGHAEVGGGLQVALRVLEEGGAGRLEAEQVDDRLEGARVRLGDQIVGFDVEHRLEVLGDAEAFQHACGMIRRAVGEDQPPPRQTGQGPAEFGIGRDAVERHVVDLVQELANRDLVAPEQPGKRRAMGLEPAALDHPGLVLVRARHAHDEAGDLGPDEVHHPGLDRIEGVIQVEQPGVDEGEGRHCLRPVRGEEGPAYRSPQGEGPCGR